MAINSTIIGADISIHAHTVELQPKCIRSPRFNVGKEHFHFYLLKMWWFMIWSVVCGSICFNQIKRREEERNDHKCNQQSSIYECRSKASKIRHNWRHKTYAKTHILLIRHDFYVRFSWISIYKQKPIYIYAVLSSQRILYIVSENIISMNFTTSK